MSSLQKAISPTLSNLIAEANYSFQSAKEKILTVYNYAIQKEGYTPQEAGKLVYEKIVTVSKRYIREMLPDEAKQTEKTKKSLISNEELVPHPSNELSELEKFRQEKALSDKIPDEDEDLYNRATRKINIPTAYDLKEAEIEETEEEQKEQQSKESIVNNWADSNIKEIRLLAELQEKINKEYSGTYDVELKDSIIPLKWKFSIKKGMFIEVDMVKARRLNLH